MLYIMFAHKSTYFTTLHRLRNFVSIAPVNNASWQEIRIRGHPCTSPEP